MQACTVKPYGEKYVLPDDETIRSEFVSDVVVAVREFREWQYR
jgi:hypothetical protein